jgi:hypothetical protein
MTRATCFVDIYNIIACLSYWLLIAGASSHWLLLATHGYHACRFHRRRLAGLHRDQQQTEVKRAATESPAELFLVVM